MASSVAISHDGYAWRPGDNRGVRLDGYDISERVSPDKDSRGSNLATLSAK
jgi:hypothetical protein